MAPQVRALAQSESKARFMARLGLDERKDEHKQLYAMMKVGRSLSSPLSSNIYYLSIKSNYYFTFEKTSL